MGFRKDAFATVWGVEPVSETMTKVKLSISRKNRKTGEYETDFSGFVGFIGTATAKKAMSLKERERIRLGDTDVTSRYDKEKNATFTNFKVFSFETMDGEGNMDGKEASGGEPAPSGSGKTLPF